MPQKYFCSNAHCVPPRHSFHAHLLFRGRRRKCHLHSPVKMLGTNVHVYIAHTVPGEQAVD